VNNLGASPVYASTAALQNDQGVNVTTQISYGGSQFVTVNEFGSKLTDDNLETIISNSFQVFPKSTDAIYVIVPGQDIKVGSICDGAGDACGFHTTLTADSGIKWAISSADVTTRGCVAGCNAAKNGPHNPNTNVFIDTLFHEIVETMSDPSDPAGWIDLGATSQGENGDLCADVPYFNVQQDANGKDFDVMVGTHPYLVQSNMDAVTQCCTYGTVGAPGVSASNSHDPNQSREVPVPSGFVSPAASQSNTKGGAVASASSSSGSSPSQTPTTTKPAVVVASSAAVADSSAAAGSHSHSPNPFITCLELCSAEYHVCHHDEAANARDCRAKKKACHASCNAAHNQ